MIILNLSSNQSKNLLIVFFIVTFSIKTRITKVT
jgi:hypothetical protein